MDYIIGSNIYVYFLIYHIFWYLLLCKGKPNSPSKPTIADIKATKMRVSWIPPDFDGGTSIVGYQVEYKEKSSKKWVVANLEKCTNTTVMVSGLEEKTQYQFRVAAKNLVGLGTYSTASDLKETLGTY